jgi:hypothetical protein
MNGSIERRVDELKQCQSGSPEQKTRGGTGASFFFFFYTGHLLQSQTLQACKQALAAFVELFHGGTHCRIT